MPLWWTPVDLYFMGKKIVSVVIWNLLAARQLCNAEHKTTLKSEQTSSLYFFNNTTEEIKLVCEY